MITDLETFKTVIIVLKNFTLEDVSESLLSTRIHYERSLQDYEQLMHQLKQMLVNYRSYETEMLFKGSDIQYYEIENWIPIFQMHQRSTIFPETKKESVNKITRGKEQLDYIDLSLEEARLGLKGKAKKVRLAYESLKKLEAQIHVLNSAAEVNGFLTARGYKAGELSDYELPKLFRLYQKEGAVDGLV